MAAKSRLDKIEVYLKKYSSKQTNKEMVDGLAAVKITISIAEVQAQLRRLDLSDKIIGRGKRTLPSRRRRVDTLSISEERSQESQDYKKVLKHFDTAMAAFLKHDFKKAQAAFEGVLEEAPGEMELCDRCRAYTAMCKKNLAKKIDPFDPKSSDDFILSAVWALNEARLDEARGFAAKALDKATDSETKGRALYLCASVEAADGKADGAVKFLDQAVSTNECYRYQARYDLDFETLEDHDGFIDLVHATAETSA